MTKRDMGLLRPRLRPGTPVCRNEYHLRRFESPPSAGSLTFPRLGEFARARGRFRRMRHHGPSTGSSRLRPSCRRRTVEEARRPKGDASPDTIRVKEPSCPPHPRSSPSWPEESREAAELVIEAHGEPQERTPSVLIWHHAGPFLRMAATKAFADHNFPVPHTDSVTSVIAYRVPPEKVRSEEHTSELQSRGHIV